MDLEIYFAVRDAVGLGTKVIYHNKEFLIKDLPRGRYDIFVNKSKTPFSKNEDPNTLPSRLLKIAEEKRLPFRGIVQELSNLNIHLEDTK